MENPQPVPPFQASQPTPPAAPQPPTPPVKKKRGTLVTIIAIVVFIVVYALFRIIGGAVGTTIGESLSGGKPAFIAKTAQDAKEQLNVPTKIDDVTTLTDITGTDTAVVYHYVLNGVTADQISADKLKTQLISKDCSTESTHNVLNKDINLEYSYVIENTTDTFDIIITKADC